MLLFIWWYKIGIANTVKAIREGFIVDDEDDEEEEEEQADGSLLMVKKKRKKRRRSQREEEDEEGLDEDDLDLVMENTGVEVHRSSQVSFMFNPKFIGSVLIDRSQSKFKRLKQGRRQAEENRRRQQSRDLNEIFFSDEEDLDAPGEPDDDDEGPDNVRRGGGDRGDARGLVDEFADFIEEDEMSEEEGRQGGSDDDMQMAGRRHRERNHNRSSYAPQNLNLREGAISDMQDIFGQGDEYDFALVTEEDHEEEGEDKVKELELKDVFEPSELADRMLTDEDNEIRLNDVPERYQIARKPYAHLKIGHEQIDEEGEWIARFLMPKKRLPVHLQEALVKAIKKILEFFVIREMEVPFVFQHRKDYLIHAEKVRGRGYGDGETQYEIVAERLISQDDLWEILDHDLKFRAYYDKRQAFERTYKQLKDQANIEGDREAEDGIRNAETGDQVQDMHDYIHFRYHSQLKDIALTGERGNGFRRPGNSKTMFERIRNGRVYGLVRAFGISAGQFSINVQLDQKREFAEDPLDYPHSMSDEFVEDPEFSTGQIALQAAKFMLAEEMFTNPSLRKALRERWFTRSLVHVNVTEKGVKKIDEQHQFYVKDPYYISTDGGFED